MRKLGDIPNNDGTGYLYTFPLHLESYNNFIVYYWCGYWYSVLTVGNCRNGTAKFTGTCRWRRLCWWYTNGYSFWYIPSR